MIIRDGEQGSDEWYEARRGIPTASEAAKIITPKTGVLSAQSELMINQCLAELSGVADPDFNESDWMVRGRYLEEEARLAFQLITGNAVETIGFITNDDRTAGASPDALFVDRTSGLEIKVPKPSTHMGYLRYGKLPDTYRPQVHMSMVVSEIRKWHFFSYCPGLNNLIVTVEWDEYTDKVAKAIDGLIKKIASEAKRLNIKGD